jgi:hypothetical protein
LGAGKPKGLNRIAKIYWVHPLLRVVYLSFHKKRLTSNPTTPPSAMGELSRFWLFCLSPLAFLLPKILQLFGFLIFCIWAYLMETKHQRNVNVTSVHKSHSE